VNPNLPRLVLALLVGAGVAAGCFLLVGLINHKVSDVHSKAWVVLPIFDAAGVIARLDDQHAREQIFDRIPDRIRQTDDVQSLARSYSPRYWRTLFRGRTSPLVMPVPPDYGRSSFWIKEGFGDLSENDRDELRQLWLSLPKDHPAEWLQHRLAVFSHVLGMTADPLWGAAFMQTNGYPNWIAAYYAPSRESTTLQKHMQDAIASLGDWWFFRPWFYMFGGALMVALLLMFFRPEFSPPLLLAMSGVLHELGLLVAAPSPDFRYSHYLVFSVGLAVLLLIRSSWREGADLAVGSRS
jgi:hypothetical protein